MLPNYYFHLKSCVCVLKKFQKLQPIFKTNASFNGFFSEEANTHCHSVWDKHLTIGIYKVFHEACSLASNTDLTFTTTQEGTNNSRHFPRKMDSKCNQQIKKGLRLWSQILYVQSPYIFKLNVMLHTKATRFGIAIVVSFELWITFSTPITVHYFIVR